MSAVLGGMVKHSSAFTVIAPNHKILANGHPDQEFRTELRRISNVRNAISIASIYCQAGIIFWIALTLNNPLFYVVAFLLIGRTNAQLLALMHESAHRLLFSNRLVNDFVGRWILGYPSFTNTDGYRRVHRAHHRQEFGPNEPDIALYANYPVTRASFWRKMRRDAFGKTGWRLLRQQLRDAVQTETVHSATVNSETVNSGAVRSNTQRKIFAFHLIAFLASVLIFNPYIYVGLWLLPYLTVWRVMNRLRSIAEHGGLRADSDRRVTTHSVRQHWLTRFYFVPFNLGWHIAHHLDAGIPFRSLPEYHKQLRLAGFVSDVYEYRNYRQLWRASRSSE